RAHRHPHLRSHVYPANQQVIDTSKLDGDEAKGSKDPNSKAASDSESP
ncbi:MAG: hypothetical protein RL326_331, partial [Pseudomonadota bacterium]